jgi:predicted nucleic acid-binding protein
VIAPEKRVYLDANVLIYAMETDSEEGMLARRWLRQMDLGRISGVTSGLTALEVLPHPIAAGDTKLVGAYRRLLMDRPTLRIAPVSDAILARATEIRASLGSTTPDALHVATALLEGCDGLLTNDDRLKLPSELVRYSLPAIALFSR